MDATQRWPFPDSSAAYVYSDNVIEHIKMAGVRTLFAETFRVLLPGGSTRISTPDIGRAVQIYLAKDDDTTWHMENGRQHGFEVHHPIDILRSTFQDSGHDVGYLWDESALRAELARAGFTEITRHASGESDDPELRGLDRPEDAGGSPFLLILEGCKPPS